jgi:ring-1,2-phenylacetyl-CoA epoxidase subunit PaaC
VSDALVSLLTALADDELIIGHRHSEWTGFAPHLEEDVAFSSIAQDEIGHAAAFYDLIAKVTGGHADRIAFGREPSEYRHAVLCERPNRDWAYTLARHWLYDTAEELRLDALETSAHSDLGALARKMRREERYHLLHADAWMRRIARGPVEGRTRIIDELSGAFAEAMGLFEPFEQEQEAVANGWLPAASALLLERFQARVGSALDEWGLPTEIRHTLDESAEFVASSSGDLIMGSVEDWVQRPGPRTLGGRRGRHSEDFNALWADLTATYRASPEATW